MVHKLRYIISVQLAIYWAMKLSLSLNIEKTNFMLFTPKRLSHNMDCISIHGHSIKEVKQTEFLAVIIDIKLNWHAHCQYICGKMSLMKSI